MSVGTIGGDVFLWDVVARQMISEKGFEVWKLYACSDELQVYLSLFGYFLTFQEELLLTLLIRGQASFNDDERASVNHVAWSPDGSLIGICQLFSSNLLSLRAVDKLCD